MKKFIAVIVMALASSSLYAGVANTKTQSLNESARGYVGTGDCCLIGGIIVHGKDYVRVVIRAIGPELSGCGLLPVLQHPTLELHAEDGRCLRTQKSHKENCAADAQEIEACGLTPTYQSECAIVVDLAPGNYTAIVRGENGTTGFGLVEIYKQGLK